MSLSSELKDTYAHQETLLQVDAILLNSAIRSLNLKTQKRLLDSTVCIINISHPQLARSETSKIIHVYCFLDYFTLINLQFIFTFSE